MLKFQRQLLQLCQQALLLLKLLQQPLKLLRCVLKQLQLLKQLMQLLKQLFAAVDAASQLPSQPQQMAKLLHYLLKQVR